MTTEQDEQLPYEVAEAKWMWQETAHVYRLHRELAYMYRNRSKDQRTINTLWEQIEEREEVLRALGVQF